MSENGRTVRGALLGLHAQTAMHSGSGTALGTVDLPVQRERHTMWPNIAGSALKGILRDACRETVKLDHQDDADTSRRDKADADDKLTTIFGPPTAKAGDFAGALSVSDGRVLAFPVRSLKGVHAWVTCPTALERLRLDAALAGLKADFPKAEPESDKHALVPKDCPCVLAGHVVLEEYEYQTQTDDGQLAKWVADRLLPAANKEGDPYGPTRERFARQLLVLHDDPFTHFVRYATEIVARIGLNYETKTVKNGALFYQEFLPAESLFYAVLLANPSRARHAKAKDADQVLSELETFRPDWLQVGGDETTGKGYCGVRLNRGDG